MSADRGKLVVEFLGMPGAGKSAVSRRVAEHLAGRGLPVREPVRMVSDRSRLGPSLSGIAAKSLRVAGELLTHPRYALRSLRAIRATGQPSVGMLTRLAFNWLMQSALLRLSRGSGAVQLFDEGIYQALWSLGLEGRPGSVPRLGRGFRTVLALPDVVVIVEAGDEGIAQRLGARAERQSRADRWDLADGRAVRHGASVLGQVVDLLMEVSLGERRPRVIHVDNGPGRNPDAVARSLAIELERWARSAVGASDLRPDASEHAPPLRTI